jgi:hypothetical protein
MQMMGLMSEAERYRRAHSILFRYYENLVSRAADAILEVGDGWHGQAEEVVDRYGHQLQLTRIVLGDLLTAAARHGPPMGLRTAEVEEISCPRCELADRLRGWLGDNPKADPRFVLVLPEKEDIVRCLVIHGGLPPGAASCRPPFPHP